MKRSPMPPRTKPMKRTALKRPTVPSLARRTRLKAASPRKVHWRREALRRQRVYRAEHESCGVCRLSSFAKPSLPMDLHHIAGRGAQRFECEANWIVLCRRCHDHYHQGGQLDDGGARLPVLTPGMVVWCKLDVDPEQFDAAKLAALKGWKGLPAEWEPTKLPEAFVRERERNAA